jgi:hypothetical protein
LRNKPFAPRNRKKDTTSQQAKRNMSLDAGKSTDIGTIFEKMNSENKSAKRRKPALITPSIL